MALRTYLHSLTAASSRSRRNRVTLTQSAGGNFEKLKVGNNTLCWPYLSGVRSMQPLRPSLLSAARQHVGHQAPTALPHRFLSPLVQYLALISLCFYSCTSLLPYNHDSMLSSPDETLYQINTLAKEVPVKISNTKMKPMNPIKAPSEYPLQEIELLVPQISAAVHFRCVCCKSLHMSINRPDCYYQHFSQVPTSNQSEPSYRKHLTFFGMDAALYQNFILSLQSHGGRSVAPFWGQVIHLRTKGTVPGCEVCIRC